MRRLLVTIVAACSGSATPSSDAAMTQPVEHPAEVIHGAHGSAIDIVGLTADGTAAVSQDAEGNTRLWPTLDGGAEPIVVHALTAVELGLVRGRDGFLIASLDASGNLQFVRAAANGIVRTRSQVGDVAVEQIAMTPRYVLALRADQLVVAYDVDGHEHGRFATPVGSHTIAIVTRGDHAVAIVQREATIAHARELDLEALTWGPEQGAWTAAATSRFALSPDGHALAFASDAEVDVMDFATRALHPACAIHQNTDPLPFGAQHVKQIPLGFVDDHTLACLTFGEISWYPAAGGSAIYVHAVPHPELAAYGGSVQVTGEDLALGIAREKSMQYLGYRLVDPSAVRTGPLGTTIARNSAPLVLDRALHVRGVLAVDIATYEDVLPLDETHLLRTTKLLGRGAHEITLVDLLGHRTAKIAESSDYELHFEPATNLLAVANSRSSLIPYSPATHRFGDPIDLGERAKVFLTNPALADGVVAVAMIELGGDNVQIKEYTHVDAEAVASPSRTYLLAGRVLAVDRAARVYVTTGTEVHVYVAGALNAPVSVTTFATGGSPTIAPNPAATAALVLGDSKIALIDLDGHVRWSIAAMTAVDVGWIEGSPFVRFAAGLARLDLRDGHVADRACGWEFGLTPGKPESAGDSLSVCDAE